MKLFFSKDVRAIMENTQYAPDRLGVIGEILSYMTGEDLERQDWPRAAVVCGAFLHGRFDAPPLFIEWMLVPKLPEGLWERCKPLLLRRERML
jgi:hypothetical protein